jgi:hypothetical protein
MITSFLCSLLLLPTAALYERLQLLCWGLKGKTKHFHLKHIPIRSTLSDANKRRTHQVFEKIYYDLYQYYKHLFSDSQPQYKWEKDVDIIDSSTVSLFQRRFTMCGQTFL